MRKFVISLLHLFYKRGIKLLLFQTHPESVHHYMIYFGQALGKNVFAKAMFGLLLNYKNPVLRQTLHEISFTSPIGLAAGFDYEARLMQILPSLGFGFETIGTITNFPYAGNEHPILGRLPKSKSLMVNKGFKNLGVKETLSHIRHKSFEIPIGISIGRTNTKTQTGLREAIEDIVNCFSFCEQSKAAHSYYELNISCPNLHKGANFYIPTNLDTLLTQLDKLKLKKPVFIKMPIEKTDQEVLSMLHTIDSHTISGVIFGNLQKNRTHPMLNPEEVKAFPSGAFSGKPTFDRSNELISLAHTHFKNRFVIIGCGGVFNASDAYEKIKRGANLVQLITGMIFEGPQLISQINMGLVDLLKKDGFSHLSQAVGTKDKLVY